MGVGGGIQSLGKVVSFNYVKGVGLRIKKYVRFHTYTNMGRGEGGEEDDHFCIFLPKCLMKWIQIYINIFFVLIN